MEDCQKEYLIKNNSNKKIIKILLVIYLKHNMLYNICR